MSKRLNVDLTKLLAQSAAPMADAAEPAPVQQSNQEPVAKSVAAVAHPQKAALRVVADQSSEAADEAATANLENLNFKVPKSFRKRFRDCAYHADLRHNELLFAALEAWESLNGQSKS